MTPWRRIDKKTLPDLRKHYLQFDPYCHLNIVDMWSYRGGKNYWFKIGDTTAYKLNDYMDNSYYVTLLGRDSAIAVIQELCRENNDKTLTLQCLPHETLESLGQWDAIIEVAEDHDNHDYVFEVGSLIHFSSPSLKHKHRSYKKLIKKHPGLEVKILDIRKKSVRRLMYRVYQRWVQQTNPPDWDKEYLALKRALNLDLADLKCIGVFDGQKLIGFTVNEEEPNGYYQAFFGKADRAYPGLGLLLEHETAKYFQEYHNSKFMNLQCDSGIEGLRNYKTSMGPHKKLKKYTVKIDTRRAIKTS